MIYSRRRFLAGGTPVDLQIRPGRWSFLPGVKTPTLGFSQDYLGPTIRTRQNSELNLRYHNGLAESVAVHGHGLHVPGDVDGGPQLAIAPGERWQPALSIVQPAATCWYHSHTHGRTGDQVYRGLAGMIIIDDAMTDTLSLPRRYGVDDLPVIIQDRTFDAAGRLVYSLANADEDGWLGEAVVINGAIASVANVPAGKVRLRLLVGNWPVETSSAKALTTKLFGIQSGNADQDRAEALRQAMIETISKRCCQRVAGENRLQLCASPFLGAVYIGGRKRLRYSGSLIQICWIKSGLRCDARTERPVSCFPCIRCGAALPPARAVRRSLLQT